MKYYNSFKAVFALCLVTLAIPLYADSASTPADENNKLANQASNFAVKTVNLIQDTAITAYIYAQIALDKNLSSLNINVSTDRGNVTLDGIVNADMEANALKKLAYSTSDVTGVDTTKLIVRKSDQPFTDMLITGKVKANYLYNRLVKNESMPTDINIETNNGVVYLSGKAGKSIEMQNAINLAKTISGVNRVESFIEMPSKIH